LKQQKIALKTLAIKARVYNHIRKTLYKKRLENITEKEKIEFFDLLFSMNQEAHYELNAYKRKRQDKAEIQRLREERKKTA
jgi:hypothetical protein